MPGPPPPPPPTVSAPPPPSKGRGDLLKSIEGFKKGKLKVSKTDDRSVAAVTSGRGPPSSSRSSSSGGGTSPQMVGIFAGGMPKLKKTGLPGASQLPNRLSTTSSPAIKSSKQVPVPNTSPPIRPTPPAPSFTRSASELPSKPIPNIPNIPTIPNIPQHPSPFQAIQSNRKIPSSSLPVPPNNSFSRSVSTSSIPPPSKPIPAPPRSTAPPLEAFKVIPSTHTSTAQIHSNTVIYHSHSKGSNRPAPVTIGDQTVARKAKVIYSFKAQHPGDLSIRRGQIVSILKSKGAWWQAELDGKFGKIPSNYVQWHD